MDYFAQGGERLAVMTPEVAKDCFVGVHAEELSYDLDGEDLRVGELGSWAALANTATLEPVVDKAQGGNDEGALRSTREDLLYAGRFGCYRA